jgi:hypothetical protein
LIALSAVAFWRLLPVKGQTNPLAENTHIGSRVTITIMSTATIGVALIFNGFTD